MFYSGELEKEIRVRRMEREWTFKTVGDSETYMAAIDELRASTLYGHTASPGCIEKGVVCPVLKFIPQSLFPSLIQAVGGVTR